MYRTPLGHVRVVELAGGVALAYAARLLADLGAEVIRVGAGRAESEVAEANFNKYGCSLDANDQAAQEALSRLLTRVDILLGEAGAPEITVENPSLTVVTLTGRESATNAAAIGAAIAAQAVLALWRRRQTGRGSHLALDADSFAIPGALPPVSEDGRVKVAYGDGTIAAVLPPQLRLSENPTFVRLPPPAPGEHDDYVLRGLIGLSETALAELRRSGALRSAS
ncbi:MAG TPA: CoA transferase [Dehalococcoidia bacterium]|nr:CoA transferase [Dehalococcoidia bacterium]